MSPYTEADTRAKLIDPKLKFSGWGESQIEREHYFVKGKEVTAGKIYMVGNAAKRQKPKRVDYLLRYNGHMIAVLEAKDESKKPDTGLEQAKGYARSLDVPFAYSSNGHGFIEFDFQTNTSRDLDRFPAPEELWQRWSQSMKLPLPQREQAAEKKPTYLKPEPIPSKVNPILHPPCPKSICDKELRYFQEIAVRRVIERVMKGQKKILLTMATGTGKTFTAFQIVWKLRKSGWLRKPILFIADRNVLRNQAYNAFGPFARGDADPRAIIKHKKFNQNRDIYFSTYQALDVEDGEVPLYKQIPSDFFGLIIIDECHRSGFGKWNAILRHFPKAIQLGMTATPKQDESIDTYKYFCEEEPEVAIDPKDPQQGTHKLPAYSYSLGQGIDDGFLATYKVHRVRTTVDKDGLAIESVREQGAEIFIPKEADLRDVYQTSQFEREISLPDRTESIVKHLAGLLRRFGPKDRTMVFCVDMEHARLTARLLQNEFADLGFSDYAVPIISEEGDNETWLEQFQDSDRKTPIVATTAELLSTGVDVPSCKNIVFIKPIASPVLFKQIIGRGSRVDAATGKMWFRIIDYVNATRLFDDWDRPAIPPVGGPPKEGSGILEGTVLHGDTGQLIAGASVSVQIGPNVQVGPEYTDDNGRFHFDRLPDTPLNVLFRATGFKPRSVKIRIESDETRTLEIELKPETDKVGKIKVKGLEITIADEATFMIEATGLQLSLSEYIDYSKQKIIDKAPLWDQLHEIWTDKEKREGLIQALEQDSIHINVLAEVLAKHDADQFDLLANIAFKQPIHSRRERADAFMNREQGFIKQYNEKVQKVLVALLDKYRIAGIEEVANPEVFRLSPFREMGQISGVINHFGNIENLKHAVTELQKRLYREDTI